MLHHWLALINRFILIHTLPYFWGGFCWGGFAGGGRGPCDINLWSLINHDLFIRGYSPNSYDLIRKRGLFIQGWHQLRTYSPPTFGEGAESDRWQVGCGWIGFLWNTMGSMWIVSLPKNGIVWFVMIHLSELMGTTCHIIRALVLE